MLSYPNPLFVFKRFIVGRIVALFGTATTLQHHLIQTTTVRWIARNVSYNNYEADSPAHKYTDILTVNHPNPEFMRYELHRNWVVVGTLKEGKRHIYSKRRLYLDEDTWQALLADNYACFLGI